MNGVHQALAGFVEDFVNEPTTMPWGNRSLLLRDPDGNLVNFFTPATQVPHSVSATSRSCGCPPWVTPNATALAGWRPRPAGSRPRPQPEPERERSRPGRLLPTRSSCSSQRFDYADLPASYAAREQPGREVGITSRST